MTSVGRELRTTQIGLLSDSHGNVRRTLEAASLLIREGAGILIHLGDVGTAEVLESLAQAREESVKNPVEIHIVFGNVDCELRRLSSCARELGLSVDHPLGRISHAGKVLLFQHGHVKSDMEVALAREVDYLCHGHTHVRRDDRVGRIRVINPGALQRAAVHTVALLDMRADELRFFTLG